MTILFWVFIYTVMHFYFVFLINHALCINLIECKEFLCHVLTSSRLSYVNVHTPPRHCITHLICRFLNLLKRGTNRKMKNEPSPFICFASWDRVPWRALLLQRFCPILFTLTIIQTSAGCIIMCIPPPFHWTKKTFDYILRIYSNFQPPGTVYRP